MSDRVPEVGSELFRSLPYREKLEILSLQLFQPDEYARRTGKVTKVAAQAAPASRCGEIPSSDLSTAIIADLPVSFLSQHWAGYQCRFREDWYPTTPWEKYGIMVKRTFSIYAFTFSMLSVDNALHSILGWLSRNFYEGKYDMSCLLQACKVHLHLTDHLHAIQQANTFKPNDIYYHLHRGEISELSPGKILSDALDAFRPYQSLEVLNGDYPIIEDALELMCIVDSDFVIYDRSRPWKGRWYYPLIPACMYRVPQFAIQNWGWL